MPEGSHDSRHERISGPEAPTRGKKIPATERIRPSKMVPPPSREGTAAMERVSRAEALQSLDAYFENAQLPDALATKLLVDKYRNSELTSDEIRADFIMLDDSYRNFVFTLKKFNPDIQLPSSLDDYRETLLAEFEAFSSSEISEGERIQNEVLKTVQKNPNKQNIMDRIQYLIRTANEYIRAIRRIDSMEKQENIRQKNEETEDHYQYSAENVEQLFPDLADFPRQSAEDFVREYEMGKRSIEEMENLISELDAKFSNLSQSLQKQYPDLIFPSSLKEYLKDESLYQDLTKEEVIQNAKARRPISELDRILTGIENQFEVAPGESREAKKMMVILNLAHEYLNGYQQILEEKMKTDKTDEEKRKTRIEMGFFGRLISDMGDQIRGYSR